jgi:hypothetical protein
MTTAHHHLRLPWFALAAIVGMLSMAGEVSARTMKGSSEAPKSCCITPPPWDCCCCPAKAKSVAPAIERLAMLPTGEARLSAPAVPCECRSDEPADPASKPESSTAYQLSQRAGEEPSGSPFATLPSTPFAHFVPPGGSPPKSPLYLHTTRLLI